jgi:hypothetical protein
VWGGKKAKPVFAGKNIVARSENSRQGNPPESQQSKPGFIAENSCQRKGKNRNTKLTLDSTENIFNVRGAEFCSP